MLGSKRPGPFPLHVGVGASQLAGGQRGSGNGAGPIACSEQDGAGGTNQ